MPSSFWPLREPYRKEFMLTIRSFRNEDPPRLLALWKKSQIHANRSRLIPLTMGSMQMQVLGIPLFDLRSIILAFDGHVPVGYVHTCFGPNAEGSDFSDRSGQICFLCVDPEYSDPWGAARILLRAGEQYLLERGATEILGGSPRPSAPFYTGFYGGGEPIAIFDSDRCLGQVFQEAGYRSHCRTTRYHLNLTQYMPPVNINSVSWRSQTLVSFSESLKARNWWEACTLANYEWLEATAILKSTNRPVARIRIRIANPDTEMDDIMYGGTWDAALMDIRVHPDFQQKGVAAHTLAETLRHLVAKQDVMQIEAHTTDNLISVNTLLQRFFWKEVDTGTIYRKTVREC